MSTETLKTLLQTKADDILAGDGHTLYMMDHYTDLGVPQDVLDPIVETFSNERDSDDAPGTGLHIVSGAQTATGVYDLDFKRHVARLLKANCSGVVAHGRGTRARQYVEAILEVVKPTRKRKADDDDDDANAKRQKIDLDELVKEWKTHGFFGPVVHDQDRNYSYMSIDQEKFENVLKSTTYKKDRTLVPITCAFSTDPETKWWVLQTNLSYWALLNLAKQIGVGGRKIQESLVPRVGGENVAFDMLDIGEIEKVNRRFYRPYALPYLLEAVEECAEKVEILRSWSKDIRTLLGISWDDVEGTKALVDFCNEELEYSSEVCAAVLHVVRGRFGYPVKE